MIASEVGIGHFQSEVSFIAPFLRIKIQSAYSACSLLSTSYRGVLLLSRDHMSLWSEGQASIVSVTVTIVAMCVCCKYAYYVCALPFSAIPVA